MDSTITRPGRHAGRGAWVSVIAAAALSAALTTFFGNPWLAFAGAVLGGFGLYFALHFTLGTHQYEVSGRAAPQAPATRAENVHRELAQTIIDATPDAVLFFSDSGTIRFASRAARELFFEGREPEGENFLKLVATAPAPLKEALLGDSDRLYTLEVDGRSETYHVLRRTFEVDGELHTLLIVKYLTREISRREVDVLKRVIRVISHEVNNSLAPVASLVHSARLIAKSPEHVSKLERVFDTIDERATHLKSFLEGYARLAKLPLPRPARVEWRQFLRHLSELNPDALLPEPPATEGWFDPVQVEQVIINLLKNAREASRELTEVELRVSVEKDSATSFQVLDRGPGFSDEALRNALLPLYTTKETGSGMGLALAREIVEAHGGQLSIGNRPEGGARVDVNLPGREIANYPNLTRSRLTLTRG